MIEIEGEAISVEKVTLSLKDEIRPMIKKISHSNPKRGRHLRQDNQKKGENFHQKIDFSRVKFE